MKSKPTPQSILAQIAQIERLERGKVCMMREGPEGPYYNLQCREEGKTCSRYLPRDQVQAATAHTLNYQRFQALVDQYVQLMSRRSRAEREAGGKKKRRKSSAGPGS